MAPKKEIKKEIPVIEKKTVKGGRPKKVETKIEVEEDEEDDFYDNPIPTSGKPNKTEEVQVTATLKELLAQNSEIEEFVEEVPPIENKELIKELPQANNEPSEDIPTTNIIIEEIVQVVPIKKVVIDLTEGGLKLSPMGEKYKAYLAYQKMTPQTFLAKYPKHKFRHCVEEILEWMVKTNNI